MWPNQKSCSVTSSWCITSDKLLNSKICFTIDISVCPCVTAWRCTCILFIKHFKVILTITYVDYKKWKLNNISYRIHIQNEYSIFRSPWVVFLHNICGMPTLFQMCLQKSLWKKSSNLKSQNWPSYSELPHSLSFLSYPKHLMFCRVKAVA